MKIFNIEKKRKKKNDIISNFILFYVFLKFSILSFYFKKQVRTTFTYSKKLFFVLVYFYKLETKKRFITFYPSNLYCVLHIAPSSLKSNNVPFMLYNYMQCTFYEWQCYIFKWKTHVLFEWSRAKWSFSFKVSVKGSLSF